MSSSSTVENGFIAQSIVPLPLDILEKHGILWNVNGLVSLSWVEQNFFSQDEIGLELISEKIGFLSMVYRVFMKVDQEKSIIIKVAEWLSRKSTVFSDTH